MFQGFTPETIDFLWGLRMNNNREWFAAHKQQYLDTLYNPMKELAHLLFEPFTERSGDILKVSRIYRDMRMHPPEPYKESIWTCIRQNVDWWAASPCLFFEIRPDGVSYGFLLWQPSTVTMEHFRAALTAQPKQFPRLVRQIERDTGIEITAESYKKEKPAPDQALQPYYSWRRCIGCMRDEAVTPELFGPALGERAAELTRKLIPLYDYFNGIVNS